MKRVYNIIFTVAGLVVTGLCVAPASADPGSIGFRNEASARVLVQGASKVNDMLRRGQPILLSPGRVGWDNNVPSASVRYITIYDASQPSRVLLRNHPVRVREQDQFFSILPTQNNDSVILKVRTGN